ncbi:uncharacterized protein LOC134812464 isoform X2 [Bolinopsis microptera]|uniref:uncharacterized protein LOC134812464 isoform X2 n=1 Tax=Bolinopsis microptera TaxID=2820187 RepID=UPI003079C1B5
MLLEVERDIENRILAYEADARMISERALERTVMDESSGNVQFKTQKNMANQREFIELAGRQTTAFRHSIRSMRCLNNAIATMRSRVDTTRRVKDRQDSEKSPPRAGSLATTSSRSTLDGIPNWRRNSKHKNRVPPMPPTQSQDTPRKRTNILTKFPNIPVNFRCLEQTGDRTRPISYSDFLLTNTSVQHRNGPTPSKSAPAGVREIIRYESVQERTRRVRRIMGNSAHYG